MEKDITDRIENILREYDLSPSAFSDLIQVQRSAMSHIFSRRNRPSLDVIQKVLKQFPEINSNWLLTGIGKMKQLNLFGDEPTDDGPSEKIRKEKFEKPASQNNPINYNAVVNNPPQHNAIIESVYQQPIPPPPVQQNIDVKSPSTFPPLSFIEPGVNKIEIKQESIISPEPVVIPVPSPSPPVNDVKTSSVENKPTSVVEKSKEKEIEKIIIFYKDKTFSSYTPE